MIRFQTQRTKLPTGSAAGRRGWISTAAFAASISLIARILSACSSLPQSFPATSSVARYPDLNDPPPTVALRVDRVAQMKAELIQVRDNQERAAAQQQALH
jgi:hypothetical protein